MLAGIRKVGVAMLVGVASLGSAGVAAIATATPSGAATCTNSWQGPTTGTTDWNASAANWSAGFPTTSGVTCISLAGTYTVVLHGAANLGALQIGGAGSGKQTVQLDGAVNNIQLTVAAPSVVANGGALLMSPQTGYALIDGGGGLTVNSGGSLATAGATNIAYLRTNLTNQVGGTVTIGAASTLQDQAFTLTNNGTLTVAASSAFGVSGGTGNGVTNSGSLTVAGSLTVQNATFTQTSGSISGQPVTLGNGSVLVDTAGTGAFDAIGSSTLTGSIPTGQTITVDGSVTNVIFTLSGATTVNGVLNLNPTFGYTWLAGPGALTVASGGHLNTSGSGNTAYLRTNITNQSGGTVTIAAPSTAQDQASTTTNSGTLTVAASGGFGVTGGTSGGVTNAGSMAVAGSLTVQNATFTQTSGSVSGNPVILGSGANLVDSSGTGVFDVKGSSTLTGNIPTGQTVIVDGSVTNVILKLPGATTVNGVLNLNPSTGYAWLDGPGVLTVASGGLLTTNGSGNVAYVRTNVTSQSGGTITIAAPSTAQDQGTTTTNNGTFTVAAGGGYVANGGTGGGVTNAGSIAVAGSLTVQNATFTQTSGSVSGNPVVLGNGAILVDSSGTGAFDVNGSTTLTGNIPTGQTVTVDGSITNVTFTLSGATTVHGVLNLSPTVGYTWLAGPGALTVASGGLLTTNGSGSTAYLRTNITNQAGGTVTISAPSSNLDAGTTTTNSGTLSVTDGGHLGLSSGSTLNNSGGAVVGVTVNGTTNIASGISGPGVTLGGTLSVTTVGSPNLGHVYIPITGVFAGVFAKLSFVGGGYSVTYPVSSVALTVIAVFTTSPTPLAPKENIALTTPQVASIANATNGTGAYSATVNYGDGGGAMAASVAIAGSNGTVTGPSHTYTSPGTYTVTTSVSNTNGTIQNTTESVVVTGPTVTSFSKTKIVHGQKLITLITGTGFDATAVVTVSNPGVTVTLTKFVNATKLKLKLSASNSATHGKFNVTVTQTNGTVTVINALKVK